jgi:hypothetical protein
MTKTTLILRSFAVATTLLLAACAEGPAPDDDGVASLDDADATASEATNSEDAASGEEAMLDYVACLRGEGLDIPDPEVDADGNLRPPPLRIGPGEDAIDPEEFEAARDACGDPPQAAAGGNADPERQAAFEDAALAFAQCMRDRGYDVPDPEFEGEGGVIFRGGGPGLDANDPEQQAAAEECQERTFGNLAPPGSGTEPSADGS